MRPNFFTGAAHASSRHILVDTLGLLLNVVVHPADIQDRDGAFHTCCAGRDHYSRSSNAFLSDTRDARWR
jgi:hypothetical protein